jgi:hypothetical protein
MIKDQKERKKEISNFGLDLIGGERVYKLVKKKQHRQSSQPPANKPCDIPHSYICILSMLSSEVQGTEPRQSSFDRPNVGRIE